MTIMPPEAPDPDVLLLAGLIFLGLVLGVVAIVLMTQFPRCLQGSGGIVCF